MSTAPILSLEQVSLAYGRQVLLDQAELTVQSGRRIALLGRNGAGKSSLLRILAGELVPDEGTVRRQPGSRVSLLAQPLPEASSETVWHFVAGGLGREAELLQRFHELSTSSEPADLQQLGRIQEELDAIDGWALQQRVDLTLTRLALNPEQRLGELSGGWRRRAALARALVCDPDLLLLDEPTNHLDILGIHWLEQFLAGFNGSLIFITHDRAFLKNLATDILELDRGHLTMWPGDYQAYERERAHRLAVEADHAAAFDKKLAQEEQWVRQGIKARGTRNQGRVRALKAMREERAQRREQQGKASFDIQEAERSGRLVVEARGLSHQMGDWYLKPLDLRIMRGDKLALLGPNGSGKTSLIRLLLGELEADQGQLRHGTRLEIAYFDQQRAAIRPGQTAADYVGEGRDFIQVGERKLHIISYLADFLFTPEQARAPIDKLSGGEANRLMLARLFSQPANLLVLDEPTNDLDLETLDLLEDRLVNYDGTLILVSHDRDFVDQVATSVLAFEAPGQVNEYVGGYTDWLRQGGSWDAWQKERGTEAKPNSSSKPRQKAKPSPRPGKLSYKLERELAMLPEKIESLEQSLSEMQQTSADPDFYAQKPEQVREHMEKMQAVQEELDTATERWLELEERKDGGESP
ncbi:ATP-binding cassette domain-containing protein [Gammaproteobacteria bacterium AB-CW1]|uniref:ATP-binding protein Uup n=1 Tax=Natronospira elongata TaxID=3110268 RepID=A0AAP6JFD9_9GAMM|nr:ATP-binding cassette domain-containing protein [Gammaproteobacteria bacterium AB-CW1]